MWGPPYVKGGGYIHQMHGIHLPYNGKMIDSNIHNFKKKKKKINLMCNRVNYLKINTTNIKKLGITRKKRSPRLFESQPQMTT